MTIFALSPPGLSKNSLQNTLRCLTNLSKGRKKSINGTRFLYLWVTFKSTTRFAVKISFHSHHQQFWKTDKHCHHQWNTAQYQGLGKNFCCQDQPAQELPVLDQPADQSPVFLGGTQSLVLVSGEGLGDVVTVGWRDDLHPGPLGLSRLTYRRTKNRSKEPLKELGRKK